MAAGFYDGEPLSDVCKGTIKSRGPKFGFIETALYGDVFVLATELKNYQQGQIVKFTAYVDETGGVQGKDLKSGLGGVTSNTAGGNWGTNNGKGTAKGRGKQGLVRGSAFVKRQPSPKDLSLGVLGECIGTIKKRGRKFGFIENDEVGDVFVLADELKGYQEGQTVSFTAFNDETGGVQAKDLVEVFDGVASKSVPAKKVRGKGNGKGLGKRSRIWGGAFVKRRTIPKDTSNGVLGECKGTIKKRGAKFGFIESDEHGDVFVLADELKGYQEGQIVRFTAFNDETNQVQAKDLRSGLDGVTSKAGAGSWTVAPKDTSGGVLGVCTGTIKKRGRKFGFIDCDDHGDVFVLADELKAYQEGQVVKFTAFIDETGGVQAKALKSGLK